MRIEFNEEILRYCYEEDLEVRDFLASCKEILIPYILKNHKDFLKECVRLKTIELIIINRGVEVKVLDIDNDIDNDIKIEKETFKDIEKELIQPLYNSIKDLNFEYILKIGCHLYIDVKGDGRLVGAWREFRITNYDYQARFVYLSSIIY